MNKIFIPNETFVCVHNIYTIDKTGTPIKDGVEKFGDKLHEHNFEPLDNFYIHCQDTVAYYTVGEDAVPIMINKYKAEYDNHGFHRMDDTIG